MSVADRFAREDDNLWLNVEFVGKEECRTVQLCALTFVRSDSGNKP